MYPVPKTVYVLRSETHPERFYTGITSNLDRRLAFHNQGTTKHTASGRPWQVVVSIDFRDATAAAAFEKYLKSGSVRMFAQRHFR